MTGTTNTAVSGDMLALWRRYRWIYLHRTLGFWWWRIGLVVVGGCAGAVLGQIAMLDWKIAAAALIAPVVVFFMLRRLEVGLVFLGIAASPLTPPAFTVKSLTIYPVELALALLLVTVAVLAAYRLRTFVWPSLWAIWPQIGLIALAIIAELMIQITWIPQIPHKINATPILYSELLGIVQYGVPLATIIVTTACLTGREGWIVKLENAILVMSALAALIVCIEFKRINATVYTFRYTEGTIFYMPLGYLAQFIGLGAMLAYARGLTARRWRVRLGYMALLLPCVLAVYFTLEKSRLIYTLVGLVIITLLFSRRLFLALCVLSLPLIPVALGVIQKIGQTKAVGDLNRLIIWQDMLRVWSKRPLFGVGPGNVWPYDQVFTHLPLLLRNFAHDGLGVAHNGVLQVLAEVGPLGVVCYYAFAVIVAIMAIRLLRRSHAPEQRADRVLALVSLGLICGSVVADPVSGIFFLPPAQLGGWNALPRVLSTWLIFGCLIYKDQMWRTGLRAAQHARWRHEVSVAEVEESQEPVERLAIPTGR